MGSLPTTATVVDRRELPGWTPGDLDTGVRFLLGLAWMELRAWQLRLNAEAKPHGLPPMWFIRGLMGAQVLDAVARSVDHG